MVADVSVGQEAGAALEAVGVGTGGAVVAGPGAERGGCLLGALLGVPGGLLGLWSCHQGDCEGRFSEKEKVVPDR